jgi:hypothetical protein
MFLSFLLWAASLGLAAERAPASSEEASSLLELQAAELQRQMDELLPLKGRLEELRKRYEAGAPFPEDERERLALRAEVESRALLLRNARLDYHLLRDRSTTVSLVKTISGLRFGTLAKQSVLPSLKAPLLHLAAAERSKDMSKAADDLRIAADALLAQEAKTHEEHEAALKKRRIVFLSAAGLSVLAAAGAAVRWALKG